MKSGVSEEDRRAKDLRKKEETKIELEKLAIRRAEREVELQAREQDYLRARREQDRLTVIYLVNS